jgi:hypothetical protein
VAIEVDTSITGTRVKAVLERHLGRSIGEITVHTQLAPLHNGRARVR